MELRKYIQLFCVKLLNGWFPYGDTIHKAHSDVSKVR